jgi:Asp/Glu/hydantoin racemase
MKRALVLHASRAAVDCVAEHYAAGAPEIEFTHLLDDGVMRMLNIQDWARAGRRLLRMAEEGRAEYGATHAVLTCSAYPPAELAILKQAAPIPLFKMDEPMAQRAVETARRIGVLSTFPSTSRTTRELVLEAARRAGAEVELVEELDFEALRALLAGDRATHDARFLAACGRMAAQKPEVLVLAQVSMARLKDDAARIVGAPALESLSSSLEELRALMA